MKVRDKLQKTHKNNITQAVSNLPDIDEYYCTHLCPWRDACPADIGGDCKSSTQEMYDGVLESEWKEYEQWQQYYVLRIHNILS
ncbi:MAG: hypothetical protein E7290_09360 [Lachnospiraceae bacterium]|nr:hypothetical protein [Lachnospiraceae bacterium]